MKHPKHKKYLILSHTETFSWVHDKESSSPQKCFLLDHEVGEEIFLFEQDVDPFTGFKRFEYSIINLFEENKSYQFDIKDENERVLILSNNTNLEIAVPISFKEYDDQKTIELEVEKLNLHSNKPIFKKKSHEQDTIDYAIFRPDKLYELPIINRYTNKNGNDFYIVEYESNQYHVFIPKAYSEVDFGDKLGVYLREYDPDSYALNIARSYAVKFLFQVKEQYSFKISKQILNENNGLIYWTLEDEYGFRNNYYPDNDITFDNTLSNLKVGDTIKLFVLSMNDKGYLNLVHELRDWESKNYLAEEVFAYIGYEDQEDEYFFKYFSEFDESQEETHNNFDTQYNTGNNLWVFSYLAFLDKEIYRQLEESQYLVAKTLIDIYIKIEKWILEGSDYLTNFSPFKAGDIIQKAERKIETLIAMSAAMDIYLKGEEQEFIEDIHSRLSTSPYLNSTKKNTFKQLVKLSEFFSADSDNSNFYDALLLIIRYGYLDDDDKWSLVNSIESRLFRLKNKITEVNICNANIDNKLDLLPLISDQYLLVVLLALQGDKHKLIIASVNLLRYISIYNNDISFLDLAINILVKQAYLAPNILHQTNVSELGITDFEQMIKYPDLENSHAKAAGKIQWNEKGLIYTPKNLWDKIHFADSSRIFQLEPFDIFVNSDVNVASLDDDLDIQNYLRNVSSVIKYRSGNNLSIDANQINKDTYYYGRVKPIQEKTHCYLECNIDGNQVDTLLHINAFHRTQIIDDIGSILKEGDYIKFKITDYVDGKFRITSSPIIADYADTILENSFTTIGKVVFLFKDVVKIITKEGLPVVIYDDNLNLGEFIELTIEDYNQEYHNFTTSIYKNTIDSFEASPEKLFREFLKAIGVILNKTEGTPSYENRNLIHNSNLLIYCLEQRLNYITDPKDLVKHYFAIIEISQVIHNYKSYIYNIKLNHFIEIIKLQYSEEIDLLETALPDSSNEESLELKKESEAFELINYLNTDVLDIPLQFHEESAFYILKKLIESYNLINKLKNDFDNTILNTIKRNIIKELYNITIKTEVNTIFGLDGIIEESYEEQNERHFAKTITNLGSESKDKEFKSSIFYSASDTPQSDIILRTICGFLNSYEKKGSLFIGVDDTGEITGLKEDLANSSKINNLDQYQNHIQSLIVAEFPKEINAIIDFKFHKSNNLDYLEMIIPSHSKPISYKNEFYQRQGVQTRILKGPDLIDFVYNKANPKSINSKEIDKVKKPFIEPTVTKTSNDVITNPDFYNDLKMKGEVQEINFKLNNDNLLANLYIFEDDTYMISSSEINDYQFKIPITEKYRFGHLLFCYDNACVNKVEIRSVINRAFNKRYMNAKSAYGNLMVIYKSLPGDQILIETKRFDKNYLKIFEVDKISEHRGLNLKGNCIVQDDIDKVEKYYHISQIPNKFKTFKRESKQGLGANIDKYSDEYNELMESI